MSESDQHKIASNKKGNRIDLLTIFTRTLLVFNIGFLVIMLSYAGVIIASSHWPSAYNFFIRNPMLGYKALIIEYHLSKNPYRLGLWHPPSSDKKGLVTYDPGKAYNGLTLYISAEAPKAILINMKGAIVHEWSVPFNVLYGEGAEGPDFLYKWGRAHLTPDGNLFVLYDGIDSAGLLRLDKDSNILWKYERAAHHDIAITDSGLLYTFTKENRTLPHQAVAHIEPPFEEDFLVTLDSDGREISKISLFDAFMDSPAEHMLSQLIYQPSDILNAGDMIHPNSIEVIGETEAGKAPFLARGHLLLSFRNNSLLAILDPATEKITWASYGPWKDQHDPKFLDDGTIIMFDNEGHLGPGGASRVIRIDLATQAVLWQFTGSTEDPLYSQFNSSVDPLPNGNILVTQSMSGRLFEVTQAGEIVWDYRTAARIEHEGKIFVPAFFRGRRYLIKDLPFLQETP